MVKGQKLLIPQEQHLVQRPRVALIQRRMTQYRIPLFEMMRKKLDAAGIELTVVFGDATPEEKAKMDEGTLSWGVHVSCRYWFKGRVCWQNPSHVVNGADLVIITQENKLIYNLLALTVARPRRIAFWGHGRNMQAANPKSLKERFKRWTTNMADWWFAYTSLSIGLIKAEGFPCERITNLENAIDTQWLRAQCESVTDNELAALRAELGILQGKTALFIGSLYEEKRIDFLLAAGARLAESLPGFSLIIVGDGPQRSLVEQALSQHAWLRYVGTKSGRDKAFYLRVADVFMNPGLVGLGILDAFVVGVPLVTTDCGLHSPEIDYLVSGKNGLMTTNTLDAYVEGVTAILTNPVLREQMRAGARAAGEHYTIENMANNFCKGIEKALKLPA